MGITGGIVEYFAPGDRITFTSSGSVTGGNVVTLVGDRIVSVSTASNVPVGVALHNAANGEIVSVALEGVWPLTASTTITQGELLQTTASGQVAPIPATTNTPQFFVGIALADIAASGTGPVKVRL